MSLRAVNDASIIFTGLNRLAAASAAVRSRRSTPSGAPPPTAASPTSANDSPSSNALEADSLEPVRGPTSSSLSPAVFLAPSPALAASTSSASRPVEEQSAARPLRAVSDSQRVPPPAVKRPLAPHSLPSAPLSPSSLGQRDGLSLASRDGSRPDNAIEDAPTIPPTEIHLDRLVQELESPAPRPPNSVSGFGVSNLRPHSCFVSQARAMKSSKVPASRIGRMFHYGGKTGWEFCALSVASSNVNLTLPQG